MSTGLAIALVGTLFTVAFFVIGMGALATWRTIETERAERFDSLTGANATRDPMSM